ncbi:MAG: hypothetical protein AAGI30_10085 [Planctomycetota bacterium]
MMTRRLLAVSAAMCAAPVALGQYTVISAEGSTGVRVDGSADVPDDFEPFQREETTGASNAFRRWSFRTLASNNTPDRVGVFESGLAFTRGNIRPQTITAGGFVTYTVHSSQDADPASVLLANVRAEFLTTIDVPHPIEVVFSANGSFDPERPFATVRRRETTPNNFPTSLDITFGESQLFDVTRSTRLAATGNLCFTEPRPEGCTTGELTDTFEGVLQPGVYELAGRALVLTRAPDDFAEGSTELDFSLEFEATGCGSQVPAGDTNCDGAVDATDFITLLVHFGTPDGATVFDGDTDGDGDVDEFDFLDVLVNFGTSIGGDAPD